MFGKPSYTSGMMQGAGIGSWDRLRRPVASAAFFALWAILYGLIFLAARDEMSGWELHLLVGWGSLIATGIIIGLGTVLFDWLNDSL
jgi:hypothetical protein